MEVKTQKLSRLLQILLYSALFLTFFIYQPALGQDGSSGTGFTPPDNLTDGVERCGNEEGGVPIGVGVGCDQNEGAISDYLVGIINFLAAAVLLVVTAMVIVAGIQYIEARGNPQLIEGAKQKVSNAIIALVTYIFMYTLLQWLVPGGVF